MSLLVLQPPLKTRNFFRHRIERETNHYTREDLTMLVSATNAQGILTPSVECPLREDDQAWKWVLSGSALIYIIAEIASRTLKSAPFYTFSWATIGFTLGFLAKKTLFSYNLSKPIGCRFLELSRRFTILKGVVLVVSLIASFIFPVLAAILATGVGLIAGFSFWAPRTTDRTT
jgi:hypothetical protein